jgi:Flp pilus assembly protein CpaB
MRKFTVAHSHYSPKLTPPIRIGQIPFTLRVSAENGFLVPYDKADVILTQTRFEDERPVTQSIIIMRRLLVLATDTEANPAKPKLESLVVVAVYPDEAKKLRRAASQGELRLSMSRVGDDELQISWPVKLKDLLREEGTKNRP